MPIGAQHKADTEPRQRYGPPPQPIHLGPIKRKRRNQQRNYEGDMVFDASR
ncbi:hypothetical protein LCGC14_0583210 [marine sediment metagenome]|uniref:Uncharacterized protein n=1 Tax=marine sediment metagenome TaxID=412755 RepID=A0A0F9U1Y6_9ZZZZ